MSAQVYPVFLRLEGRRVALVGGGRVAAAKLPALRAIVRPIYVTKGILPEVAEGLKSADTLPGSAGEQ